MLKFNHKRSRKASLPPGTLVHIGAKKSEFVKVTVIDYDADNYHETEVKNLQDLLQYKDSKSVTWINVDGLHKIELIEEIGGIFGLHSLTLEDVVNTGQRPKYEDYDTYMFIVLKMLFYDENNGDIQSEQVSLILGKNYVISFQETEGDIFDPIRARLREAKGRIRKETGSDYLAYALIDSIVDSYFLILEKLGERIEIIEEKLLTEPSPEFLSKMHQMKKDAIILRKSIWPLREVVSFLTRSDSPLIFESTKVFFRDVYDHTIQVIDAVETSRDIISGMLDIYLSSLSNKLNEVMKVLTMISTIFIPITFIAGVYGMNFKKMPELEHDWGYPVTMGVMGAMAIGMLIYFRKKKWL